VDLGRSAGPFVRVAAAGGASPASDVAGAEARFSAWIGRVAAAPVQVALGPVELFASGGLDAGLVFAEGVGGLEARGRTRTRWLTLRQALHVRLALGRAVDVELEAAMVEPLHRVTYVLNAPDAVVHRTPAVSAAFGLSFLYRPTPRNGRPLAFRDHGRLGRPIPP